VTLIGGSAFASCHSLTSIAIPDSVTGIGNGAFLMCSSLTNVVIGSGVSGIGTDAFYLCAHLDAAYFKGDAPWFIYIYNGSRFIGPFESSVTLHYLPGTSGWGPHLGYLTAAPWLLPAPLILSYGSAFGIRNNAFGFRVSWATNATLVVERSTELVSSIWLPLTTNTIAGSSIPTNGWFYFSDPDMANYPNRFYRVRAH
jgi:hypothetical protein